MRNRGHAWLSEMASRGIPVDAAAETMVVLAFGKYREVGGGRSLVGVVVGFGLERVRRTKW